MRFAESVHVVPVVRSCALVLAFVLLRIDHRLAIFHLRHRAGSIASVRVHFVRIAGWAERVALLESGSGRHDVNLATSGFGQNENTMKFKEREIDYTENLEIPL